jgi:mannose-6-phosphate isomerase
MKMTPYPLRLQPAYKDYLWGGDRIPRVFGRDLPPGRYAESWELSARPEGPSAVANGPLAGRPLADAIALDPRAQLGAGLEKAGLPLLVKIIDARERLSVQVHPDDAGAARHGGEAKTEMWYVLAAEPGAAVWCGLAEGVTRAAFEAAAASGHFEPLLRRIPIRPGDAIFVPGGRVHAVGEGALLLETQQNSNTTYRVYDWGRVGPDGRARALHVAEALRTIDWDDRGDPRVKPAVTRAGRNQIARLADGPHFRVDRVVLGERWSEMPSGRFRAFFVARGAAALRWENQSEPAAAGTTFFVPAAVAVTAWDPLDGPAEVIRITVP